MISDLIPIEVLEREYEYDAVYREKLSSLRSQFSHFRRTRPDGNCFFRAFCYAFIEYLIENRAEFEPFTQTVRQFHTVLLDLGFPEFTTTDFYSTVSTLNRKFTIFRRQTVCC